MVKSDNIEEKQIIQSDTQDDKEKLESNPLGPQAKLSGKDKQSLAREACNEIKQSLSDTSSFFSKLEDYNKLYEREYKDNLEAVGGSKVFIPMGTVKLDGITDKIAEAITEPENIFTIKSSDIEDPIKLEAINKVVQDILDKQLDFDSSNEGLIHNAGKQRTAIGALTWDRRQVRRTRAETYKDESIASINGEEILITAVDAFKKEYRSAKEAGVSKEEYKKILSNLEEYGQDTIQVQYNHIDEGIKLAIVNREDFVMCPSNARTFDESTGHYMRVWRTWQDFKKGINENKYDESDIDVLKSKVGRNDDKKDKKDGKINSESSEATAHEVSQNRLEGVQPIGKNALECFVGVKLYDLDGDGIDEPVLVEFEYKSQVLLSIQKHPYWHGETFFNKWVLRQRVNRFDGTGIIELLEHLVIQLNTLHNQRNNFWNMMLSPTFLKKTGINMIPDPVVHGFQLGRVYEVDAENIDAVFHQLFKIGSGIPNFIQEEMQIQKYIDDITVSDQLLSGRESPTDPTAPASKTIALLKMAASKLAGYVRHLTPGYNRMGRLVLWLIYQFGKDEYTVKVGEDQVTLTKEDFYPENMTVELSVSTTDISKQILKQEALESLQVGMSVPLVQQNPLAQQELLENFLKSAQYTGDRKKILMTEEELKQLLTQEMQRQAQEAEAAKAQEMMGQAKELEKGMEPEMLEQGREELAQELSGQTV